MNPIETQVQILSNSQAARPLGCIQHRTAAINKALIITFVIARYYEGRNTSTFEIVTHLGQSSRNVRRYLSALVNEGKLTRFRFPIFKSNTYYPA